MRQQMVVGLTVRDYQSRNPTTSWARQMKVKKDQQQRLLNNARQMIDNAQSQWGKAYWSTVYTNLLKKFKRLN